MTSCTEEPVITDAELHHDGPAVNAPLLPTGTHEAAARFPASITSAFQGRQLNEVEFFLLNLPTRCEVRVFGANTDTDTGDLLYFQEITNEVSAPAWNTHTLPTPIDITGEDIWICVQVTHNTPMNTIGCDPGPANANGDWLRSDSDNQWITFRERTNQATNINWNIRGHLAD